MAKRKSSEKPKHTKKSFSDQQVAEILIFANANNVPRASDEFNVAERTIWRWKSKVDRGQWQSVAELISIVKTAALERCKDKITEVYEMALDQMKEKMPQASYRDLLETVVETGGLKAFTDALKDEGGTDTGPGTSSQAGQNSNTSYPGGKGIQKTLRVV